MNIRLAFISDIHGNSLALSAVLADISRRGIDAVYNLGDSLFGPLDVHGTFDLLISQDIKHIMGNGDRELLLPDDGSSSTMNRVRGDLTSAERAWLKSLPLRLAADDLVMFHGSPDNDSEYLLENVKSGDVALKCPREIESTLSGLKASVAVCGHSHLARVLKLPGGRLVVNAGSVGLPAYKEDQPRHKMETGSPHARYVILKRGKSGWDAEIICLSYDWRAAANLARANGRPDWAYCLETGFAPA